MTETAFPATLPRRAPPSSGGTDRLRRALADPNPATAGHAAFLALTAAVPHAAPRVAAADGELARLIEHATHPRDRVKLRMDRRPIAVELLNAAVRALCTAPVALGRLAGHPVPRLPTAERRSIDNALSRAALICGITLDETAERRLTDVSLEALASALAEH